MSFLISTKPKPWKQTKVWKVVRLDGKKIMSPVYDDVAGQYRLGKTRRAIGKVFVHDYTAGTVAQAGIYVFRTLRGAKRDLADYDNYFTTYAVLEMEVDPKDFLYHSRRNEIGRASCRERV